MGVFVHVAISMGLSLATANCLATTRSVVRKLARMHSNVEQIPRGSIDCFGLALFHMQPTYLGSGSRSWLGGRGF